ncbi:MAG: ROK family protein [Paracoccaceae bacterium]|nr:MAG: ROK family protein [Paracoccaceae bacterium]
MKSSNTVNMPQKEVDRKSYGYNPTFRHCLTLYIEASEIHYRLIDCQNQIAEEGVTLVKGTHLETLGTLVDAFDEHITNVGAISVGVAAAVDTGRIVFAPEYPSLAHLDLKNWLMDRTGLPVVIENDMNAAVFGFSIRDETTTHQSIVYLYRKEWSGCWHLARWTCRSGTIRIQW